MKTLKIHLLTIPVLFALSLLFCASAFAQNTYDWHPTVNAAWNNKSNWLVNGSVPATYPGLTSSDIVRVGVNTAIAKFGNQPTIPASVTYNIASLTFGNNNAAVGATGSISLTIGSGSTLNVTGTVLQMHSATGGAANSGGRDSTNDPNGFFDAINTSIYGPGTLHCSYFTIGDNTTPGNPYVNNTTNVYFYSSIVLNVDNDFTLNSASYHLDDDQTVISRNSDAEVSLQSCTITINGQLKETNYNPYAYVVYQYSPLTSFSIDLWKNANSSTLNLAGATALNISTNIYCNNTIDFYNINASGGTGTATVNYTGSGNQRVYTYNASLYPDSVIDNTSATDYSVNNIVYQNLGFSGSGTKTIDGSTLSIGGNFSLLSGTDTVDLKTNNVPLTIGGNYISASGTTLKQGSGNITVTGSLTNAGTLTLGSGNLTVSGDYSNTGTYTQSTGTTTFNGTSVQHMTDGSTAGTVFKNVLFSGNANKNLQSGSFYVASTGVMTLSGTITHVVSSGANNLTFISDVNGSATLAALPNNCTVNGTVTVQRYVSANRAYRLLSSPVYMTTDANSNNIYSVNYLLTNSYLTGTGSGFSKTGNPTLYLYRENLAPLYSTFLNSNFRGIADISSPPNYLVNSDAGTYNIPVGNGYLFYFRGSSKQATLATLTTAGAAATTDTLNATGTLNQGSITVHNWYTPASANLGYTTISGDPTVEGMNLVGNPYPSSIDWNQYGSGISETNVSPFCYQLIPTGLQGSGNYGVYQANKGNSGTNGSTNIIASGEGFFVQASGTGASLTFTEAAKVNTQVTGGALFMAKIPLTPVVNQTLHLQMKLDSINSDEIIINFDSNTKSSFNPMEDARYRVGTGKVNLASLSSDNIPLAINQLPLALKGDTIKLKVNAATTGTYTLNLKSVTGIPQIYDIWLKDALTKDSVNLRTTSVYSFSVNISDTTTFGANRFKLILVQDPALAYQLLSFDAAKAGNNDKQVQLTWKTQNEQNYTNFTVERSNDNGKTFDVLGDVISSAAGTYNLLDKNPLKGDNQYRLKSVDLNNTITYSNVVDIQFTDNSNNIVNHISAYPNPAINTINLSFEPKSQEKTTYDIRVTNSAGMVVKFAQVTEASWQQNVSNLLMGTYVIQVTDKKDNSIVGQTKFVKL